MILLKVGEENVKVKSSIIIEYFTNEINKEKSGKILFDAKSTWYSFSTYHFINGYYRNNMLEKKNKLDNKCQYFL